MKKAFTLIELLIVVAIIAILAAIAVPNFLEAQTRAKVSRVMTDMRVTALALEAYTVDYNVAPIDSGVVPASTAASLPTGKTGTNWYGAGPNVYNYWGGDDSNAIFLRPGYFDYTGGHRIIAWWEKALTTPIGYTTKRTMDIFHQSEWIRKGGQSDVSSWYGGNFIYRNFEHNYRLWTRCNPVGKAIDYGSGACLIYQIGNYKWALYSSGPSLRGKYDQCHAQGNGPWVGNLGFPSYDPTNGTKSWGYMVRSNKGIYNIDNQLYGVGYDSLDGVSN